MAIRPIVKFGHPVLHAPSRPVEQVDDEIRVLVADMIQTMYAAPGVGLAAPQVGVPLRLAVIDVSVGERASDLIVLVNPEIIHAEGVQETDEGCLSAPGFVEETPRAVLVDCRFHDLDGKEHVCRGEGLLARAFQHEIDHLDGRLFVDRVSSLKRAFLMRKLKKKVKSGEWE